MPLARSESESSKLFRAIDEPSAGIKWQYLFKEFWPHYERWFLKQGDQARPSYMRGLKAIRQHMPELEATYSALVQLAGGGDTTARFLSLYCPPAYLSGCTQAVWTGDQSALVRNYDYSASRLEGVILKSQWNDKTVIAMTDGLWGVLDGINDSGLSVSLAFGGRLSVGIGFGIPIILRYVLEFCDDTVSAIEVLRRVPCHMSYNVTILDKHQRFATVYVTPDRLPVVRQSPVATNHQGRIEWPRHAWATATLERESAAYSILTNADETLAGLVAGFQRPPIYNTAHHRGFGTLYTAVYRPAYHSVEYIWPQAHWQFSPNYFDEQQILINF
ncbi:MAG: hypothetical protein GKR95_18515 [Gammaproteobacteria bacterium]|nr:hypothetical protein [Gammaproteobacteria bacterium]